MNPEDWAKVVHAYDVLVHAGNSINKIEGDGFIIYRVGSNVIRIDVKVK